MANRIWYKLTEVYNIHGKMNISLKLFDILFYTNFQGIMVAFLKIMK